MKWLLIQAILISVAIVSTSCNETPKATNSAVVITPSHQAPLKSSKTVATGGVYTWVTAAQGPSCLPNLIRLMKWYGDDTMHSFQFVRYSINTAKAQGHYLLNQPEANRYLAALQRSGYFSASYLASKKKGFQDLAHEFAQAKQTDGEPEGLTTDQLFPVTSFADMLELQDKFSFTLSKENHTILFDTGEAILHITFDNECKVSSIKWVRPSPQLD